jgi:SAM-dependent methyltransferase
VNLAEQIHDKHVHNRRARVLSGHLAEIIPNGFSVLDVGCGDGLLARLICRNRPGIKLRGIDIHVRPSTHIPVDQCDGQAIPFADATFDAVMFVDVLHHTSDPMALLREGVRVARRAIVIKDHTLDGLFAGLTLRLMDRVGNTRHGVPLPYNYWPRHNWIKAFETLGLEVKAWKTDLGIYPWPATYIFDRSFHFIALLDLLSPVPARDRGLRETLSHQ